MLNNKLRESIYLKLRNNEKLDIEEIKSVLSNGESVDQIQEQDQSLYKLVVKLYDRYYLFSWSVENENVTLLQPYEVIPHNITVKTKKTMWITPNTYVNNTEVKDITKVLDSETENEDDTDSLFHIIEYKNIVCPDLILCTASCPFYNSERNNCQLIKCDKQQLLELYNNNKSTVIDMIEEVKQK